MWNRLLLIGAIVGVGWVCLESVWTIGRARGGVMDGLGCHAHLAARGIGDKDGDGTWQGQASPSNDSQFTYQI